MSVAYWRAREIKDAKLPWPISDILHSMSLSWRQGIRVLIAVTIGICTLRGQTWHGMNPNDMDRSVIIKKPADLYSYANGMWLDRTPIPADKAYVGTFDQINERNLWILKSIAEQAAKVKSKRYSESPTELVGTMYRLALDEATLESQGSSELSAQLSRLERVQDTLSLIEEIAHLQALMIPAAFSISVESDDKDNSRMLLTLGQGGQILPDRQLYFGKDSRSVELRAQYLQTMSRLMAAAGYKDSLNQAKLALKIETLLADASSTPIESADPNANYNIRSSHDIKLSYGNIPWDLYFHTLGTETPYWVIIRQPRFMTALSKAIASQPMSAWRSYLRVQCLYAWAPYLSDRFVKAQVSLTQALTGSTSLEPRWKRAVQTIDLLLGDALGQLFVKKAFNLDAKAATLKIIENVKTTLRERIGKLEWMSPATQSQAVRKLDALAIKVGYPDKWRSYVGLRLRRDSYVLSVMRASGFKWSRQLAKLGKPVDRSDWTVSPATVNAYYNPAWNEIVLPAGILQPGFFDLEADTESNYGSIGAIVGHEIAHGFDDQGAQYDAKGNLKNWWTQEDKKRFDDATEAIVSQYDMYVSPDGYKVDGKFTLRENIADIGGLAVAYLSYHKALKGQVPVLRDGLTGDQRFFVTFAQNYRSHYRPELARLAIAIDPHSPDAVRVEGAVSDQLPFYQAFGLKPPLPLPRLW